jgi:RES domain-containing protein
MQLHPQSDLIRERMRRCLSLAQAWEGTFYRATTVEFARRADLLAGRGTRKFGGRWTPPGLFAAVYGSLEPETAMAEALANYRQFGIPVSEAMPLVFVAIRLKLKAVLDLNSTEAQRELAVVRRRMTSVDWQKEQEAGREAITQAIGRIAWEQKLEGLLVPSARRHDAQNIVLFPSRRRTGSSWRIRRARKLPRKENR